MSFNGSGLFVIDSTGQPVSANTLIESSDFNALTADLATGLSNCITKDGQQTITDNLPMAGYRHTGVGNAAARTDYAAAGQVQDGKLNWVDGGGTADAITATYSPTITALVDGQLCCVRATAANATTTPTFSPNGLTARTIVKKGGAALAVGDISADGHELILRYDLANTRWELLNPHAASLAANTFTGLQTWAASADIASAATVDLTAATGNTTRITGTTATSAFTMTAGQWHMCVADGAWPLTYHATTNNIEGGASYTCAAGDIINLVKGLDGVIRVRIDKQDGTAVVGISSNVDTRQTVLSGPVTSAGLPDFGGSTGSTTVTASGTLIATAANGFNASGAVNRIGSILNPSWTGLSADGTRYLYLDIAADGTCTTGHTALPPLYRWGGADVTTNDQFVFNVQAMQGKVGNGSVASQTYRVFVGQVTISGSVVTAIVWYALMGRFTAAWTSTLPGTSTTITADHNLGIVNIASSEQLKPQGKLELECITAEYAFSIGDTLTDPASSYTGAALPIKPIIQGNLIYITTGASTAFNGNNGGAAVALTAARWKYRFKVERGW